MGQDDDQADIPDIEKVRRHQRVLRELGRMAAKRMERDVFLTEVCALVSQALEVSKVKVLRFRSEHDDLLMEAGVGWKPGIVGASTFDADLASPPGCALKTGEPIVISDIAASEFRTSPVIVEHGVVSLVNAPILIDGAGWGVLEADSSTPRDFSKDTVDFLMSAAFTVSAVLRHEASEEAHARTLAQAGVDRQRLEALAAETQHRTRNSFSMVLAILALQRPRGDSKAREMFDAVIERVQAIALAHDQLDPAQHRGAVDMPVYLRALCGSLDRRFDFIAVDVRADALELPPERAIAVGLIVNELVTDSVKHAFDERGGSVCVGLQVGPNDGKAELTVADNGRGVEAAAKACGKEEGGDGTRLLDALARRIGGEIVRESSSIGTLTRVRFSVAG